MKLKFICSLGLAMLTTLSVFAQEGTHIKSVNDYVLLELDSTSKWKIDAPMMKPIQKSFELINSSKPNSKAQAKKLGKRLLSLSDDIIEHCKMKSNGHYVFHSWLNIYIEVLEELKYIEFQEDISYIMRDVHLMVKEFDTYFE